MCEHMAEEFNAKDREKNLKVVINIFANLLSYSPYAKRSMQWLKARRQDAKKDSKLNLTKKLGEKISAADCLRS